MRILAIVALALALAPVAGAKTVKVNWREHKTIGEGAVRFHVTKIVLTPTAWAVTAAITNVSGARMEIDTKPPPPPQPAGIAPDLREYAGGMALVFLHSKPKSWYYDTDRTWWSYNLKTAAPALPRSLANGASWTGTFRGTGKLKKGVDYRVGFGQFRISDASMGETTFMWISDHSVRL